MRFLLTDEQTQLQELARKAANQLLGPTIAQDEAEGIFRADIIPQWGAQGLSGIATPAEYGGSGLGSLEYVLAIEELAAVSTSYAISVNVSNLPQSILSIFGTPEQKKKYIPPLASGAHIGAFSLSESFSGSDAAGLKTRAQKEGDFYVLNGTKLWCTQGNLAQTTIVFARTGAEGTKGISAFIVEKGTPGFRTGKIENKMGLNCSPTCELILENVRVPASHLVAKEGDGFKIAMAALDSGRIAIGATAVGVARAAMEFAISYAKERHQFQQPLSQFQAIQFLLADMNSLVEASRLLVQKAAFLKDEGRPYSKEAATAKFFATDAAMKVTTDAVQILGGVGYTKEYPVERYMREAKVLQIVEGTNQIQRVVVGRALSQ